MKTRFITVFVRAAGLVSLLLAACRDSPLRPAYRLVLPELPPNWREIVPEPRWRAEWIGGEGLWQKWEGGSKQEAPYISPPPDLATPVLAWPFWPEWDIEPGMMRPAGALFPWDVSGENLTLSWKAGPEAFFWKELAAAARAASAADGRFPWHFDWPRFRELLESGALPDAVLQDPWLPDWKEIGRRTVHSGFDRRRILPGKFTLLVIPGLDGRWIGASPFAAPLEAPPGGPLPVQAADTPGVWISSGAVLKCSSSGWVLRRLP